MGVLIERMVFIGDINSMCLDSVLQRHNKSAEESNEAYRKAKANTRPEIKPLAKNDFLFNTKPKIPKSGTSLYDGFYIRQYSGTEFIYHIESGLYVARMNKSLKTPMEARVWIDENYDEIMRRINLVLDVERIANEDIN